MTVHDEFLVLLVPIYTLFIQTMHRQQAEASP